MGDYLLAKCLISATETRKMEILSILAETSKRLSKGELLQIEKSRKLLNFSPKTPFEEGIKKFTDWYQSQYF